MEPIENNDMQKSLNHLAAIHEWARRYFCNDFVLEKTNSGINNDVYIVKTDNGTVILKYFPEKRTYPDRFNAEFQLLTLANKLSPEHVPKLIKHDKSSRIMILEFIEGKQYTKTNRPTGNDIDCSIQFYKQINSDIDFCRKTVTQFATDYFPSLQEHINHIDGRIKTLSDEQVSRTLKQPIKSCLSLLRSRWKETKKNIAKNYPVSFVSQSICKEDLQISPSDFGFHNALQTKNGPVFFDFEFSGWDDPAKTVVDFFLQPKVPIEKSYFNVVAKEFCLRLKKSELINRIDCLNSILRIKWLCIILNILNKNRRKEMEHTVQNFDTIIEERLEFVQKILEEKKTFGIY